MVLHLLFILFSYLLLTQVAEGNIDEFDCVDIYKQPAFQHPLLKNHKIQEKFSSGKNLNTKTKYKPNGRSCPKGTVPIFRQRNDSESFHLDTIAYPRQHFAVMETISDGSIYRGAEAEISIHNVTVRRKGQYSKSQIWLENGPRDQLNSIQVGWAADGYKQTGCYNTLCPGFVILSKDPWLGSYFDQSSIYGGESTVVFTPQVFHDGFTGNWALKIYNDVIGYWPNEIFTHLNQGASMVRFGGNTFVSRDGISPPMGNGYFPIGDYQKSSSFLQVKVRNSKYETVDVSDRSIRSYVDSECFKLMYRGYNKETGVAFSYGGPGGNCGI